MSDRVRQAFERQAHSCEDLGSAFTARLCRLAAARLTGDHAVGRQILDWPGDPQGPADALALRLAGALHALVLSGQAPGLASVYPPNSATDDMLWGACDKAMRDHADFVLDRLASAPQTNEVRRSSALLPGFLTVARLFGKPLKLSEIGASAGLNLQWDRYRYRLDGFEWGPETSPVRLQPDWQGPPPPDAAVAVEERAGCDLNPLDPSSPEDSLRLTSYIWADQSDRLERTRAALAIARENRLTVDRADAIDWLEKRLDTPHPGVAHVIYHTIAWQYLPETLKARGEALIASAGERATTQAPVARLQLEADGKADGAGLSLQVWPTGERHEIGRADFHGRWVKWTGWPGH